MIFPKKSEPKPIFKPNYYIQKSHFEALPDTKNEIVFLGDSFTEDGHQNEEFRYLLAKTIFSAVCPLISISDLQIA